MEDEPRFVDAEQREWLLRITVAHSREILSTCGIDLSLSKLDQTFEKLGDCQKLAEVLWILIEKQAERQGVSPDDFAAGLDGKAIDAAGEALIQAVVNFTPARNRPLVETVLQAAIEAQEKVMNLVQTKKDQMIEKVLKDTEKKMETSLSSKQSRI